MRDDDQDDVTDHSRRRGLIGLLVIAVLVVAVLFVMFQLRESARMQDCLASGRTNCAPIETRSR